MDDPFDALAPPTGRNRRQGSGAADRFAAWWDRVRQRSGAVGGASAHDPGANPVQTNPVRTNPLLAHALVMRMLAALGIVGVLAVGAWWLSQGRAPPVELPRAPSAAASAEAAGSAPVSSLPAGGSGGAVPAGGSATPPGPATPGNSAAPVSSTAEGADTANSLTPQEVVVHVAGQVHHPGLYTVNVGGRLADAISAAGGVTAQADLDRVNLAEPLIDGARTYIPAVGQIDAPATIPQGGQHPPGAQSPQEGEGGPGSPSGTPGASGEGSAGAPGEGALVNINTADEAVLDELPGVGPVTAEAIVEYRNQVGSFSQVEDLLEVRGIGDAKLEALIDLVTV